MSDRVPIRQCTCCGQAIGRAVTDPLTGGDKFVRATGKRIFGRIVKGLGMGTAIITVRGTSTKLDLDISEVLSIGPEVQAAKTGHLKVGDHVAHVRVVGIRFDALLRYPDQKEGKYIFLHEDDLICQVDAVSVKDFRGEGLAWNRPTRSM